MILNACWCTEKKVMRWADCYLPSRVLLVSFVSCSDDDDGMVMMFLYIGKPSKCGITDHHYHQHHHFIDCCCDNINTLEPKKERGREWTGETNANIHHDIHKVRVVVMVLEQSAMKIRFPLDAHGNLKLFQRIQVYSYTRSRYTYNNATHTLWIPLKNPSLFFCFLCILYIGALVACILLF